MSDKLYKISIEKLLKWILEEEKTNRIFGYYKDLFFIPADNQPFKLLKFGHNISTPFGVAAGPHTQLSQNIVLSWLFGARYIELKTVQILDEIKVSKPCIAMNDEGYNCEWSQELKIKESFDEYLNAWIIIHILRDKFGWNEFDDMIFNMSIGYNLSGIKSDSIQWFIDKMTNAESEIAEKVKSISKFYPRASEINIPKTISNSVTLSTMHGCPSYEIESIGKYLIEEKKLHTIIKLNPTLLGKDTVREILNQKLNYDIEVPDSAFEHDLMYEDAVKIIKILQTLAKNENVDFGLKLTNTLETVNKSGFLPDSEKMVYMSGRALHPISINLAAKLQNDFHAKLDISFSAGVDTFNFSKTIACGLKPITVCSDLLKPGGYSRLPQYIKMLQDEMQKFDSKNLVDFIKQTSEKNTYENAILKNLNEYAKDVLEDKRYTKSFIKNESIKTNRVLTQIDCIHAPCIESCAISQNVPDYMYYTSVRDYDSAFSIITDENPLPNITGMVCDHLCQSKCTRVNIDNSLLIREIKRFISANHFNENHKKINSRIKTKIAIIGAGPSGLSAAYFLIQAGFKVEIFEEKTSAGGMVSYAIPKFRIDRNQMLKDIERIKNLGVIFHFDFHIDKEKFNEIKNNFDYIYLAVGAQKGKSLNINGENLPNVFDQISFLKKINSGQNINLGKDVAIIGGGNSAMDAARTAKRIVGNGNVSVIYRRTQKEMPADKEEIKALLDEEIKLIELTVPEQILQSGNKLKLICTKVKLLHSENDKRGRLEKIPNSESELFFDSIITAIGQDVDIDFYNTSSSEISKNFEENILIGGDFKRGADSLINAIADGKEAANSIISRENQKINFQLKNRSEISLHDYQLKLSKRIYGNKQPSLNINERNNFQLVHPLIDEEFAVTEASRCLMCNDICNICVSVCPNIANQFFIAEPENFKYAIISFKNDSWEISGQKNFIASQKYQIINIADFCNECGNCDTFCPTSGAPYKIKPRFSLSRDSFYKEDNIYFIEGDEINYKLNNKISVLKNVDGKLIFKNDDLEVVLKKDFSIISIQRKNKQLLNFDMQIIAKMYYYLKYLKTQPIFINEFENVL